MMPIRGESTIQMAKENKANDKLVEILQTPFLAGGQNGISSGLSREQNSEEPKDAAVFIQIGNAIQDSSQRQVYCTRTRSGHALRLSALEMRNFDEVHPIILT
ncbi:hypothetical protein WISP_67487 [Willisornis vidua]|uniref:Uncharacterized protein n=1 Tax=Willisornis vidua TaxID=1566151 RepID=A0ABQ9D8P2_9PASS|nr:hypothetical protein WISP_67487 [Willisornis vidua]